MLYPQNGDGIMAVDFVTSLRRVLLLRLCRYRAVKSRRVAYMWIVPVAAVYDADDVSCAE